ncbi:DUF6443 domain-containing protein, partial [Flavobacteriaceae bacterium]|nr:DUF6443 domain-containing protein [Flavobacteriaceae bacterium]
PSGADLVATLSYDAFGRQDKSYLPTPMEGTAGSYRDAVVTSATDYYGVTNPYSETVFEASPLNRVMEQKAPGTFANSPIKQDYDTNGADEVNRYDVADGGEINESESTYAAGTLYKNELRDENGKSTYTYTDLQGRVVLKRAPSTGEGPHDTYYLYDDYGNLRYVLPPAAEGKTDATTLAQLCYQYTYDYRNRLTEKQLPGKGVEYIAYDSQDRPVLTQDALMRAAKKALKTEYDAHSRVVKTGFVTEVGTSQETLSNNITKGISEVLTEQFYDDYNFNKAGLSLSDASVQGIQTRGLPTGSRTKVLDTDVWITTLTGYDSKGRVVYTATNNPALGVVETQTHSLDFVGRVTQTTTTHSKGSTNLEWTDAFAYDTAGRLLTQKRTINNTTETLAAHCYNDLGQLERKSLGGELQTLDYAYNIRGWLTQTNTSTTLTKDDLFGYSLSYLPNGNISDMSWLHSGQTAQSYAYGYDALNRILSATSDTGNYSVSGIRYDKNGNIENLNRQGYIAGSYGALDELSYTYIGNQLQSVQDAAAATHGFIDGANSTTEYTYDLNGNMLTDANKGKTTTSRQVAKTEIVETLVYSKKTNQLPETMPDPYDDPWSYLPGGDYYSPDQDGESFFNFNFESKDFIHSNYDLYTFYEDVIYGRYDPWMMMYTEGSDPFEG